MRTSKCNTPTVNWCQLPPCWLSVHRNRRLIRDGSQDVHLDFHTAHELWPPCHNLTVVIVWPSSAGKYLSVQCPVTIGLTAGIPNRLYSCISAVLTSSSIQLQSNLTHFRVLESILKSTYVVFSTWKLYSHSPPSNPQPPPTHPFFIFILFYFFKEYTRI